MMTKAETKAADLILKRLGNVEKQKPNAIVSNNPVGNPFYTEASRGHMIGTLCCAYRDLMQGVLLRQQASITKKNNDKTK